MQDGRIGTLAEVAFQQKANIRRSGVFHGHDRMFLVRHGVWPRGVSRGSILGRCGVRSERTPPGAGLGVRVSHVVQRVTSCPPWAIDAQQDGME